MPQKYFEPSSEEVIRILRKLRQEFSGLYFGVDAIANRVIGKTRGKYVRPVVDKLADEGNIEIVEIQASFLRGTQRRRGYRAIADNLEQ